VAFSDTRENPAGGYLPMGTCCNSSKIEQRLRRVLEWEKIHLIRRMVARVKVGFCFFVLCATVSAQWLNHPTPGMPRTPDGKPNLSASAPRTADDKPDLSGLWGMNPGPYTGNIATDLKPEDVQSWADGLFKQRAGTFSRDDPSQFQCLPQGPRANLYAPVMEKFIQTPGVIAILIEDLSYRQIFLDGRGLPKDPEPSFMGYSVGHWDGDTLVAESTGFKDRTWLDMAGHPHTEALRITERFHRRDFGHMEIAETIDDPKAFNKPFTITIQAEIVPDTEILEYVCAENEKDHRHLVGAAFDSKPVAVTVAPEVLIKYVGSYEFAFPENPTVPAAYNVTMSGGTLFMDTEGKGKTPLIPVSETIFFLCDARIEFVKDAQEAVTHFTRTWVEGDLKYMRKPDRK